MEARMKRMEDSIFGNGQKGLQREVQDNKSCITNIDKRICDLCDYAEKINTSVNGLLRFQVETSTKDEIIEKQQKERKKERRQSRVVLITQAVAILIFIAGIFLKN